MVRKAARLKFLSMRTGGRWPDHEFVARGSERASLVRRLKIANRTEGAQRRGCRAETVEPVGGLW